MLAYDMGADYLEQDIVATRDDELVVLHDIHLDRTTDVATRFLRRQRSDGRYYVRDFTLAEIRSLVVHERRTEDGSLVYPTRHQGDDEVYRVHTFVEELDCIARLQNDGGRAVGIYPELKRPAWHRKEGVDITPRFLQTLADYGYRLSSDAVYVQCFDDKELLRLRDEFDCKLKLIQLVGENSWGEADTDYDAMLSAQGLQQLSNVVNGIGPWIDLLFRTDTKGAVFSSGIVENAHNAGLAVHPYTFRKDDLPSGFNTFAALIQFAAAELSVDGLFTDFPDATADILTCSHRSRK